MHDRREFIVGAAAFGAAAVAGAAPSWAHIAQNLSGAHGFDFLAGDWRIGHRFLRRSAAGLAWAEGTGVCRHRRFAGEWGNVEEYVTRTASGTNEAVGLRAYDPASGTWAIWWLDGRDPSGPFEPSPKGRFDHGIGTFLADIAVDGRPTRQRLQWSQIAADSARWEQAHSTDAGRTWETNWIMAFQRAPADAPISLTADTSPVRSADFDFLFGDWDVRHRKLLPDGSRWVEFDGTCTCGPLVSGWANLEEHFLPGPTGTYRATGIRAFDAATGRWSIRWVDQRLAIRPLDPAVTGRFENGIGQFYSDYEVEGRPARGRLKWSEITRNSAHFEQAQSLDGGRSWSPNWTMEFRRRGT